MQVAASMGVNRNYTVYSIEDGREVRHLILCGTTSLMTRNLGEHPTLFSFTHIRKEFVGREGHSQKKTLQYGRFLRVGLVAK